EKLSVESARCEYNLARLIRHGPEEGLTTCEVKNAEVVINPMAEEKHPRRPKRDRRGEIASIVHDVLFSPLLAGERASVEHATVTVRTPDGDVVVHDASVSLGPSQAGWVRVQRLEIPNVRMWENIAATATFAKHDLLLRDIA